MIRPVGNNSAGETESALLTEQRRGATTEIRPIYIHTVTPIETPR